MKIRNSAVLFLISNFFAIFLRIFSSILFHASRHRAVACGEESNIFFILSAKIQKNIQKSDLMNEFCLQGELDLTLFIC